jgi:hypothetical protein
MQQHDDPHVEDSLSFKKTLGHQGLLQTQASASVASLPHQSIQWIEILLRGLLAPHKGILHFLCPNEVQRVSLSLRMKYTKFILDNCRMSVLQDYLTDQKAQF